MVYLLGVVDDNLSETAAQDAEGSQDGTKCVDPHEVELSLHIVICHGWKAETAALRTYHGDDDQTKTLDDGCNSI